MSSLEAHKGLFRNDQEDLLSVQEATLKLLAHCRAHNWAGYDPYDALNSKIFEALPVSSFRWPRLAFTQAMKRCPFNLRPLLLVRKTQNPKALALFLTSLLKLSRLGLLENGDLARTVADQLIALRSPDTRYWCWGYSFPWQTRTVVVPRGAPNLVCTSFVAGAFLDAYEQRHDSRCLDMAVSSAEYLMKNLYWTAGRAVAGFSYPRASLRTQVHNANFL